MKALFMKVFLFSLLFCALFLSQTQKVYASSSSTEISSDIVSNTIWDKDSGPYTILGEINIATGTTLTINPGTVVLFDYGAEINVSGKIIADGANENKIYFTSINDNTLNGENLDDIDPDFIIKPSAGDYVGFSIAQGGSADFQNAEIRYAQTGIFTDSSGSLSVKNTRFLNNGLPLDVNTSTNFLHSDNEFVGNTKNVINVYGYVLNHDYNFSLDGVPYTIFDSVYALLAVNSNITIDPGVTILSKRESSTYFNSDEEFIIIGGSFNVNGTSDKRITFDGVNLLFYGNNQEVTIKNTDMKNLMQSFSDYTITKYDSGKILIDGLNISNVYSGIYFSGDVSGNIENTNITTASTYENIGVGILLNKLQKSDSILFLRNVSFLNKTITSLPAMSIGLNMHYYSVVADNLNVDGFAYGLGIMEASKIDATKLKIKNSSYMGMYSQGLEVYPCDYNNVCDGENYPIKLRKSEIYNNDIGFVDFDAGGVDIMNSSFHDNVFGNFVLKDGELFQKFVLHHNTLNGANTEYPPISEFGQNIKMKSNWWGDKTGPYNATSNPDGKGGEVSDGFDFSPWLIRDPTIPQKTPVLIVPGVLGTEISKQNSDGTSEKLWLDLAHNLTDLGDEFMDILQFNDDLTPKIDNLLVGDVLKDMIVNIKIDTFAVYDYTGSLIQEFKKQGYTEGEDLYMFPYDWRYGVNEDNVNSLKNKITDILNRTGSEKVDVVAHSTGGLLVKKYVMENPSTNNIGKAVFVGVPNTGAPKAIKTLLMGDNFGNLFLADSEMQKISKNLPVVYDLAPSAEYYKNKGSFVNIMNEGLWSSLSTDLSFDDMTNYLINDHQFNSQAWTSAQNLHTTEFDNYDMRNAGVDVFAVDGCKTGTIKKVTEIRSNDFLTSLFSPKFRIQVEGTGDSTVPLESATNLPINESNKFFALKASHGEMLSQDGIRQKIVDIFSGNNSSVSNDLITQDISKCELNGRAISVYSPISIDVIDSNGNHSGLATDGISIENNIPNADYEIIGEHKFVYLPTDNNQNYTIKIAGTGNGVFTITDENISSGTTTNMQVFSKIPVTSSLIGNINLGSNTSITLDTNGDGVVDSTLQPNAVLNAVDSQNFDPETFGKVQLENNTIQNTKNSSGGHLVLNTNDSKIITSSSVEIKPIITSTTSMVENISTSTKISYNIVDSKEVKLKENIVKPEKKNFDSSEIASSVILQASVGESGIKINYKILIGSIFGVLLLMFVGRKIIR